MILCISWTTDTSSSWKGSSLFTNTWRLIWTWDPWRLTSLAAAYSGALSAFSNRTGNAWSSALHLPCWADTSITLLIKAWGALAYATLLTNYKRTCARRANIILLTWSTISNAALITMILIKSCLCWTLAIIICIGETVIRTASISGCRGNQCKSSLASLAIICIGTGLAIAYITKITNWVKESISRNANWTNVIWTACLTILWLST